MYVLFCHDGGSNGRIRLCDEHHGTYLVEHHYRGLAFGIATTAGITLAIDITNATLRSAGNVSFSWMARLGMIIGIVLGVWLYQSYSFKNLLSVSVITGAAGVLMVSGVYVPFRAPIVTRLYSFDRFCCCGDGCLPSI